MHQEDLKAALSALKRYELTELEKRFVHAVEHSFNREGNLTDQQKSILEGLYREKIRLAKIIEGIKAEKDQRTA